MRYGKKEVEGINVLYREAGQSDKPTLVLFHGFPSASHMFRDLMPMLEADFHMIAPDYPGFGQSDSPDRSGFDYTFDHIADMMDAFLEQMGVNQFYMYVFDYGAPIGFRIANKHPEHILGIISQNGNVYQEGLGKKWAARAEYWRNPTPELREQYKSAFAPETVIGQYTYGTEEGYVSPDGYSLDLYYSHVIPDYAEKQSDLIFDYQNNVKLYPAFQKYLQNIQAASSCGVGKKRPVVYSRRSRGFSARCPGCRDTSCE